MKKIFYGLIICVILASITPENVVIPVQYASAKDWNHDSYWFAPWGKSGVHKGIDIFARKKTPVLSASIGLVMFTGYIERGGNVVAILSPKGRIHYYAHLEAIKTHPLTLVNQRSLIGRVGNSGNATGKAPHLHYSVLRLIPNPADITLEKQGWKRMFYINPNLLLTQKQFRTAFIRTSSPMQSVVSSLYSPAWAPARSARQKNFVAGQ
jgi:peptidoglycan LD-endopeptidase LytH